MEPKELGDAYMHWIENEIATNLSKSDGWWEKQGAFPMLYWLTRFKNSVINTTSGAMGAMAESLPKSRLDMMFVSAASGAF